MKRFVGIIVILIFVLNFSCIYAQNQVEVDAKAALLIEEETGEILYSKNIEEKFPPASITKLMTYLITIEAVKKGNVSIDDDVIISLRAARERGASYQLKAGEVIKLGELVKGMMIVSANDAAVAIAEHVGGSVESFVEMMNEKAQKLGLNGTHFVNPNGMPEKDEGNVMTAKDIGLLAKYIIHKHRKEVLPLTDTEIHENRERGFYKANTNGLLKVIPEVDGLKTGYTDEAGYCLVSTMIVKKQEENEKDFRLIGVILGTENERKRVIESKKLLEYGILNYTKKNIIKKDEVVTQINLWGEKELPIQLLAKEDVWTFGLKEGMEKDREISLLPKLPFPIHKGQKLGQLKILLYNDKEIKVDLVSDRDIVDISFDIFITRFWAILSSLFTNLL